MSFRFSRRTVVILALLENVNLIIDPIFCLNFSKLGKYLQKKIKVFLLVIGDINLSKLHTQLVKYFYGPSLERPGSTESIVCDQMKTTFAIYHFILTFWSVF